VAELLSAPLLLSAALNRESEVKNFRRFALRSYVFLLWITGQLHRAKNRLNSSNAVLVLMLHRVLDKELAELTCSQPDIVLLRSTFERMVRYMVSEFEIVDLRIAAAQPSTVATRPRLAVTFDDGWSDNYTAAFPAISGASLNCCIFICPQLVGKTLPFWPERVAAEMRAKESRIDVQRINTVIERLKVMPASEREGYLRVLPINSEGDVDTTFGWSQALEMQQAGVSFGSHTSTHQMLTRIPPVEAQREILDSRIAVQSRMGHACDLFAYPNGDVSPRVREMVKDAGYRLAFTTRPGFWTGSTNPLEIPRVNVSEDKVTGLAGHFSRAMFDYSLIWKAARNVAEHTP
jgi:peptidoglycan/xylan/chitin deacetylase (PgdA/CDA1 family)